MRCRGMQGVAEPPYLGGFLFSGLLSVAPYCVPGGIRVVSTAPWYRPNDQHDLGVELHLGQPENESEQGADEHDRICHRSAAGERAQARDGHQRACDQKVGLAHPSSVACATWRTSRRAPTEGAANSVGIDASPKRRVAPRLDADQDTKKEHQRRQSDERWQERRRRECEEQDA